MNKQENFCWIFMAKKILILKIWRIDIFRVIRINFLCISKNHNQDLQKW